MALQTPQFIGWSKPLAEGVAHALVKEAGRLRGPEALKDMPIDLGSHRVIVPSSFASRLIQEHLAKLSSGHVGTGTRGHGERSGLLLPEFQTPDKFLNWGDHTEEAQRLGGSEAQDKPRGPVAAKEMCLLAWGWRF